MRNRCCRFYYIVSFLVALLFANNTQAQLSITVTSIPPTTPPGSDIYIAGNFNNWNPGDAAYQLTEGAPGSYYITIHPSPGTIEYKFTRGSWATVEGSSTGSYIPNRTYNYTGNVTSIDVSIAGWEGKGGTHTAADNVFILDEDFYIPQLDRTRRVWIYLPPDYESSAKRYPVVYMQDGQNLFDAFYSFAGVEWEVDESMNELNQDGDDGAIVVGVDNGGVDRINEYSPWFHPQYGGGDGELYASFLANTLKPHIDSHYRTLPAREYTAIAGSSLGANISLFTAIEYPDIFSKVGIFSPAFWFSDSIYEHVTEKGIVAPMRFYFVAGDHESATIIENMMEMFDTLESAGQPENEMELIHHADGAHSEWYWAREYPAAYEWLFDNIILGYNPLRIADDFIYPNPAGKFLGIKGKVDDLPYSIYSPEGVLISRSVIRNEQVDISGLPQGMYILELKTGKNEMAIARFIKL
jgi:metallo-beta-lactamase class B